MSRRCGSRLLLSLLMLWQLFASAYAHPLGLPQHVAQTVQTDAPCHEHSMDMSDKSGMDMSTMNERAAASDHALSSHTDSCKSSCKCPCAGTPALSFALAFVAHALPELIYVAALTDGIVSQPPSKLLRPPI